LNLQTDTLTEEILNEILLADIKIKLFPPRPKLGMQKKSKRSWDISEEEISSSGEIQIREGEVKL